MKIKAGHIYQIDNKDRMVITRIDDNIAEAVWQDGATSVITVLTEQHLNQFFDSFELIAKYPTWQEAVNSIEFNGD